MPRGKHTHCSQCGQTGEFRYLELLWRLALRGPWHYVGGYLCAADRNALVAFIGSWGEHGVLSDDAAAGVAERPLRSPRAARRARQGLWA